MTVKQLVLLNTIQRIGRAAQADIHSATPKAWRHRGGASLYVCLWTLATQGYLRATEVAGGGGRAGPALLWTITTAGSRVLAETLRAIDAVHKNQR